jgi:16S rRNA (cytidine1402-2'-O)-methyltransferase
MSKREVSNEAGILYVVATPIGNLDDFTLRAIGVLREVHRIAAEDTRHTRRLLQYHGIDTPMIALHEHNERQMLGKIVRWLEAGRTIALVSDAGTPLVSDPGFPLVRECRRRGLRVSPVPGPSALLAALSVSGLPADSFCFHGFLPRHSAARRERLEQLGEEGGTRIFYESSHRIEGMLRDCCQVLGPERRGVVARELTKQYEEILSGSLCELARQVEADPQRRKGEFVVLVAPPEMRDAAVSEQALKVAGILMEELPLKQAVALAAKITGEKKNRLYQAMLALRRS